MHILFISNYFPPEVNAPATRLYEHARQWVQDGHEVEVLTSVPNFPEGCIYNGYRNRFSQEVVDGIRVTRVPMYVAENKGVVRRTLSYISFMLSAIWYSRRIGGRPGIVVATSPQFFAAIAGFVVARLRGLLFVLEIRDLWPESIVAVGAVRRNLMIRFFEWMERFLYENSDHIVVVTRSFKRFIEKKGIASKKISVLMNGVCLPESDAPLDPVRLESLRYEHGLEGKFVASYIGTIGMAHRADVMLEAAALCPHDDIVFMVVGTGAERDKLVQMQAALQLPNVRLIDKQPKELVPYLLALTDVSVVHLRSSSVFQTVIPSKIFESMAARLPIVLGVEGESRELIVDAEAGIPIPPEDPRALVDAVVRLRNEPTLHAAMARGGHEYVYRNHERGILARRYAELLERTATGAAVPRSVPVPRLRPVEQV